MPTKSKTSDIEFVPADAKSSGAIHKVRPNVFKCRVSENTQFPEAKHPGDIGFDLVLTGIKEVVGQTCFFDTGVSIEPPDGYYVEVVPRSSLSKLPWMMANSVGVIDPGYRGNIIVPLRYLGSDPQSLLADAQGLIGRRVVQMIPRVICTLTFEVVQELTETVRGNGGFGSTGD